MQIDQQACINCNYNKIKDRECVPFIRGKSSTYIFRTNKWNEIVPIFELTWSFQIPISMNSSLFTYNQFSVGVLIAELTVINQTLWFFVLKNQSKKPWNSNTKICNSFISKNLFYRLILLLLLWPQYLYILCPLFRIDETRFKSHDNGKFGESVTWNDYKNLWRRQIVTHV